VSQFEPIAAVVETLVMIWAAFEISDWQDQIRHLPPLSSIPHYSTRKQPSDIRHREANALQIFLARYSWDLSRIRARRKSCPAQMPHAIAFEAGVNLDSNHTRKHPRIRPCSTHPGSTL
jgi:hypothetical protein